MFIKKFKTVLLFSIAMAFNTHASDTLPCQGESHDVTMHIGNDNKGDVIADLIVYKNDIAKVLHTINQFSYNHIEWLDSKSNVTTNNLYLRAVSNSTSITISIAGDEGTLIINGDSQNILCDWRR